LYRKRVKI